MNSPGNLDHGPASNSLSREEQGSLRGRAAEPRYFTSYLKSVPAVPGSHAAVTDTYYPRLCGLRRDVSNAFPPSGGCRRHCTSPAGYQNGESLLM